MTDALVRYLLDSVSAAVRARRRKEQQPLLLGVVGTKATASAQDAAAHTAQAAGLRVQVALTESELESLQGDATRGAPPLLPLRVTPGDKQHEEDPDLEPWW